MQPRQELVDIWRSVVKTSWSPDERKWIRPGGYEPNSISDAEQLLCLLMPAVQVPAFGLDQPDKTGNQALSALEPLGGASEIPRQLIGILHDYFERYTVDGKPLFSGGSYFRGGDLDGGPSDDQRTLDIVDSFAMSITLSLATLGFVKVYRRSTSNPDVQHRAEVLEKMASTRLSAAMVGLLRSFSVSIFTPGQLLGRNLVRTVNQANLPVRQVVTQLQRELRQTAATFREVLIGSGQSPDLDSGDNLFECGWSWGIIRDAPEIETPEPIGDQRVGIAVDEPYLYFTVIAMDAIEDLFSERTRILGLLNDEQQRLSRALQLRSDLTRAYWATVATFRTGSRWPLEDIPWRTTDGEESEYFTLQVTSLAVKGIAQRRGSDADLMRICEVLNELAHRVRITRRPVDNDTIMTMHSQGVQLTLNGSETIGKGALTWNVLEFAPLLLQRLVGIAGMLSDARQRGSVLDQADRVWDHLATRRVRGGGEGDGLWDRPQGAFPMLGEPATSALSWYYTERVVQALVVTALTIDREPLRSEPMMAMAAEMLSEADQIFDNELMRGTAEGGPVLEGQIKEIRVTLRRARELLAERPATSASLCTHALTLLDDLAAGRQKASEVS